MRRRLACDITQLVRPDDDDRARDVTFAINAWGANGGRVALLDDAAIAALEAVPAHEALAAIAPSALYVAAVTVGALGPAWSDEIPLDGCYCASAHEDPTATFDSPPLLVEGEGFPTHGRRGLAVWPAAMWEGSQAVGPRLILDGGTVADPAADRLARLLLATVAAISNPLWVREVLPGWGVCDTLPAAPRRARRRKDPRAAPYKSVRLTPDARHVVRREAVVDGSGGRPTNPPRKGHGYRLGAPLARHDVRLHRRRIVTSEDRAMGRDDWIVTELLPDGLCVAHVPVRPHVRGKGPRRAEIIRGQRLTRPPAAK